MNTIINNSGIDTQKIKNRVYNPSKCVGYQQLSVDGTIQGLDLTICSQQPRYAICSLESTDAGVVSRYLITNEDPTSSFGMPLYGGSTFDILSTVDLVRFKITEATGTSTLNILYYV